jgi:hypothetical protein
MRRVLGSIQRFCPTAAASLHRSVDEIEAQMMDFMQYTNGLEKMMLDEDPEMTRAATASMRWRLNKKR